MATRACDVPFVNKKILLSSNFSYTLLLNAVFEKESIGNVIAESLTCALTHKDMKKEKRIREKKPFTCKSLCAKISGRKTNWVKNN